MKRPLGITILAVLSFVNVATYAALLVLALFNPNALAEVLNALSPGGAGPQIQLQMGRMLPVYYAFGMVMTVVLGVGFWRLWNWTRIFVLVLMGISGVALFFEMPKLFANPSAGGIALWLFRLGLCAFFLWYLTSSNVRAAFRGPRDGASTVAAAGVHRA